MIDTSNPLIGLGLRTPHFQQVCKGNIAVDWFEVHSENYFQPGSPPFQLLTQIRQKYPISLHGVGLSLGSAEKPSILHLKRLKNLIERIEPFLISEHLSWSIIGQHYLPDLLPIAYHQESLRIIAENILLTQDFLGRELLIENPSSYLEYNLSDMSEPEFLVTLCQQTGAKILLDVNNVYVSCWNHGWCAKQYIDAIPGHLVKEIHLAGHSEKRIEDNKILLIDTHDSAVCEAVWSLYRYAIAQLGVVPTLLEWDAKLPPIEDLVYQAQMITEQIALSSSYESA